MKHKVKVTVIDKNSIQNYKNNIVLLLATFTRDYRVVLL